MKRIWLILVAVALVPALSTTAFAKYKPQRAKSIVPGGKGAVLLFVASMCPCTDAHRVMVENLVRETGPRGIKFYAVFSNIGETEERAEYFFRNIGWEMPYYLDAKGKLAKKYNATRTPQTVVLGPQGGVLFTGPIDDANINQGRVDNPYLKDALEDILAGKKIRQPEIPPLGGCWIVPDTARVAINKNR